MNEFAGFLHHSKKNKNHHVHKSHFAFIYFIKHIAINITIQKNVL